MEMVKGESRGILGMAHKRRSILNLDHTLHQYFSALEQYYVPAAMDSLCLIAVEHPELLVISIIL